MGVWKKKGKFAYMDIYFKISTDVYTVRKQR